MKSAFSSALLSLSSLTLPFFFLRLKPLLPPSPRAPLSTSTMAFAMTQAPARVVRGNSAAVKACAARYVGGRQGAQVDRARILIGALSLACSFLGC